MECISILLKFFKEKVKDTYTEIFQLILLLSLLLVGIEFATLLGLINLIYHVSFKGKSTDSPQTHQEPVSRVQSVQKAYQTLKVPRTHELNIKKIRKRYEERRKRKELRNSEDMDSDDELAETEVYLAPSIPSNIPDTAKFSIKGSVGTEEIIFEIDTGSAISIINRSCFENIDPNLILEQRKPRKAYRDFNGGEIQFLTEALLQVQFENMCLRHYFLVTKDPKATNLVGIDLIRSKRLNIEIDDSSFVYLTFKNRDKNAKQKLNIEENKEFSLLAAEDTELCEVGVTNITAKLESSTVNRIDTSHLYNVLGEVNTCLDPFPFQKSLVNIDIDGSITVPIYNKDFGRPIVFAGQVIGKFKPLSKGTEIYNDRDKTTEIIGNDFRAVPNLQTTIKKLDCTLTNRTTKPEIDVPHNIFKIKCTNDINETDDAAEESDLVEELLPTRIPDKENVWAEVLQDVPTVFRRRVFNLLTIKHPNIVSKSNTDLGLCTLPNSEFKIEVNDTTPFSCRPYSLNNVFQMELKEIIEEMQEKGLLISESSPYSSGVFIRPRPDSSNTGNCRVRVINDYRALNSVTTPDRFPLPSMKMLMSRLGGMKHFILLDLKVGM